MNKSTVILLAAFFLSIGLNAQSKFGVKVAAGKVMAKEASSMVSVDGVSISHDIHFVDFTPSKSIGFFMNKKMGFLFAQGEALFTTYKTNYLVQSYIDDNIPNREATETSSNIDFHIVGGVAVKNFKIGVGPVFHKSLEFKSDLNEYAFYNEKKRNINAGFQAMVAYDFGPLTLDIKYEDMFNNVGDHISYGSKDSKFGSDMNAISIGLGIGF